tara:strand:+ start:2214 stop:3047 length:834 start_codon:yes stop_codon:yes gene_type:complete
MAIPPIVASDVDDWIAGFDLKDFPGFQAEGAAEHRVAEQAKLAAMEAADAAAVQRGVAESAAKKELYKDLGMSALLAGGQAALTMLPTRTQREQKKELAELQRAEAAGEQALDPGVAALMDRAGAAAGRIAGQQGAQLEGALAAGGGSSAADIRRVQKSALEVGAEAKRKVGMERAGAELGARQERRSTIASMRAQRFEEEKGRRDAAAKALQNFAGLAGKLRGEAPLKVADVTEIAKTGKLSSDEIMELYKYAQKGQRGRDRFSDAMTFFGGLQQG